MVAVVVAVGRRCLGCPESSVSGCVQLLRDKADKADKACVSCEVKVLIKEMEAIGIGRERRQNTLAFATVGQLSQS